MEVAEELGNQINTEKRFTAELRSQPRRAPQLHPTGNGGVAASWTTCYQPGNGDIVCADGLSTSKVFPNRDTIPEEL